MRSPFFLIPHGGGTLRWPPPGPKDSLETVCAPRPWRASGTDSDGRWTPRGPPGPPPPPYLLSPPPCRCRRILPPWPRPLSPAPTSPERAAALATAMTTHVTARNRSPACPSGTARALSPSSPPSPSPFPLPPAPPLLSPLPSTPPSPSRSLPSLPPPLPPPPPPLPSSPSP